MQIIHNPITPLDLHKKFAIAIGTYDGFHRGHANVVQQVLKAAKENDCYPALLTYDNHPSKILNPEKPTPLICTSSHKFTLLQATSVEYLLVFSFDREFASQTAEEFLTRLMEIAPFAYLNMGYDGKIGKNRSGDKDHLSKLSQKLNFTLDYMPSLRHDEEVVSSTAIRNYIHEGKLSKASELLGRPYSIMGHVASGHGRGKELGFPTANIPINDLITPPIGVWAVDAKWDGKTHKAIANLGVAPTIHTDRETILEIHIPSFEGDLYGKMVEIVFRRYIRPEKKFHTIQALKEQLVLDVKHASDTLVFTTEKSENAEITERV